MRLNIVIQIIVSLGPTLGLHEHSENQLIVLFFEKCGSHKTLATVPSIHGVFLNLVIQSFPFEFLSAACIESNPVFYMLVDGGLQTRHSYVNFVTNCLTLLG